MKQLLSFNFRLLAATSHISVLNRSDVIEQKT